MTSALISLISGIELLRRMSLGNSEVDLAEPVESMISGSSEAPGGALECHAIIPCVVL